MIYQTLGCVDRDGIAVFVRAVHHCAQEVVQSYRGIVVLDIISYYKVKLWGRLDISDRMHVYNGV